MWLPDEEKDDILDRDTDVCEEEDAEWFDDTLWPDLCDESFSLVKFNVDLIFIDKPRLSAIFDDFYAVNGVPCEFWTLFRARWSSAKLFIYLLLLCQLILFYFFPLVFSMVSFSMIDDGSFGKTDERVL